MRKIQNYVLNVFVICLISSCTSWDWNPNPYVGVSDKQLIERENGEVIKCDQPAFDRVVCFDEEDIASLKSAIDEVKNKKLRKKLNRRFNNLYR